jgi:predicted transposase YbfD/YdcC
MLSLIEKLKQVKDFRKDKGKRHPLWIVLVVIILGTMLGYLSYRELGEFAKNNLPWAKSKGRHRLSQEFNIIPERVPSYSTIRRVMMGMEWQSLLKVFNEWALEEYGQRGDINWLDIDGKSLKNTRNNPNNEQQNFIMFISLFSQESGLVLHLKRIENKKGSEIEEGQAIIEHCSLQNKVFTGDAWPCQKKTISLIIKSKNDDVITVKGNQKNLHQRIQDLSSSSKPESCFLEQDNSHGRKISRKIEVFKVRKNQRQGFENLRRIIKVERRGSRGDKTYEETAYYISSLTASAQVFAEIIRGHWKIENQLHWVKDVIFEEDKSQISDFQAASNWSILTTMGLNLFRSLGFLSITERQRWLAERWEKLIVLST